MYNKNKQRDLCGGTKVIQRNPFPILEFDSNPLAKIEPSKLIAKKDVPKACVITFFGEVVRQRVEQGLLKEIAGVRFETFKLPIYETNLDQERVGITVGYMGAAGAAAQLEELIAMGFEKFIVCGGAGVLREDIQVGHLVLPDAAVRDEGVSYHYVEPSREVLCNEYALSVIERELKKENVPYIKAKTWTTDAVFRETEDKIALRRAEGCVTVEMEAAAYFAVSQFRSVVLGQILYGGDDLSGEEWDGRDWTNQKDVRRNLVDLCIKIAAEL